MKKTATMIVSLTSLIFTFRAANIAFANDYGHYSRSEEDRLFILKIHQAVSERAEERRLNQQNAPNAKFIGFTKVDALQQQ